MKVLHLKPGRMFAVANSGYARNYGLIITAGPNGASTVRPTRASDWRTIEILDHLCLLRIYDVQRYQHRSRS